MKIVKLIPPKWRGPKLEFCILKVAGILNVPGKPYNAMPFRYI
jgi:hypothetical protein